jgi:hypothetical protein
LRCCWHCWHAGQDETALLVEFPTGDGLESTEKKVWALGLCKLAPARAFARGPLIGRISTSVFPGQTSVRYTGRCHCNSDAFIALSRLCTPYTTAQHVRSCLVVGGSESGGSSVVGIFSKSFNIRDIGVWQ